MPCTLSRNHHLTRTSLLCSALLFALGLPAYAQTDLSPSSTAEVQNIREYAISEGPLAGTLREISRVSGRPVSFETRDVQNARAPAINGSRHVIAAVQEVIAGTGLSMTTLANGNIHVFMPELGTVTVTAVRGEAETGFKASSSETATRSGADLLDVPQAVTVITAKVIETQQALSIQDVLQNVAGVVTRESAQGLPGYSIRGFTQTSTLSNGITDPYSGAANIAGIDRVEVLKGPQAILSGGDSLGGAVNIVTKKPTAETVRDLTLQYGSHEDKSASLDLAGALTESKKLSFRVIGAIARADHNDAGFNGRENDYLLAQLRWKDDATDLTVGASYDEQFASQGRYTYALTGDIQPIPRMRLGAEESGVNLQSRALFYSLEHAFSPAVTVVSRMQRTLTEQDMNMWQPRFPMSVANMQIMMGNTSDVSEYRTTSGDHYLRLNFETGPLAHTLSTGINHTNGHRSATRYQGNPVPVSIYQDEQFPFQPIPRDETTLWSLNVGKSEQKAVFAQDMIRFGNWNALLGLRRTDYESGPYTNTYPSLGTVTQGEKTSMSKTTPTAGLVYNLTQNTSLYASYGEGFLPQFVTVLPCDGGLDFPPMESINKELGFKLDSRDGAFSFTSAIFQLDQKNMLHHDLANNCYFPREAQRVRGFETEAAGRLLPGWNLIFNYTFTDSKDVGSDTLFPGAQPKHQGNLWTTYDFTQGALQGFGLSFGVSVYSKARIGVLASDPWAPGGARVDAGVSYERDDWSLRLGMKNLFDRELFGYSTSVLFVPVYEGRTANLTFRKSF